MLWVLNLVVRTAKLDLLAELGQADSVSDRFLSWVFWICVAFVEVCEILLRFCGEFDQ